MNGKRGSNLCRAPRFPSPRTTSPFKSVPSSYRVVCLKCNEIYDRIIHSTIGEKLNGKCEECGSKKYTEWDYESKKCPQCKDGTIGESDEGMIILAD